jgi:hypothetical protein
VEIPCFVKHKTIKYHTNDFIEYVLEIHGELSLVHKNFYKVVFDMQEFFTKAMTLTSCLGEWSRCLDSLILW